MKHLISDALQVFAAVIFTASMIVCNAQTPNVKPEHKNVAIKIETKKTLPATPQPAQETVSVPETVVDPTPAPTPVVAAPVAPQPIYSGSHQDWMAQAGIDPADYWAVDYIVSRESGWNPCAFYPSTYDCSANPVNACGLVMQNPCGKIGGDWRDPVAALVWQKGYVLRYGGYAGAVSHWEQYGNY